MREFTYDADGRRTSEKWLDAGDQPISTISYTYDAAAQLTSASDPDNTYSFTYDDLGRVLTIDNTGTPDMPQITLTNSYDAVGNRIEMTDNYGGVWSYSYDAARRMTEASLTVDGTAGPQVTFSYDAAGQMTGISRVVPGSGSGGGTDPTVDTAISYDAAGRVTQIQHTSSETGELATFTYAWDSAGQLTQYTGPEGTRNYTYDLTGQLTDVTDETGTLIEYYRYDANGNRTESHLHGAGYVTGTGNRLLSDGTYDYTYDAEGNMLTKTHKTTGEVTQFSWDYRNRLTHVLIKDANGVVTAEARYRYDVFNRRIMIWEDPDGAGPNDPQVTWVVNDNVQPPSAAQLVAAGSTPSEGSVPAPILDAVLLSGIFAANPLIDFAGPDSSGSQPPSLRARRLYGPAVDSILAGLIPDATTKWYMTDLIGSVRALVTDDGASFGQLSYESFGLIVEEPDPSAGTRFKFTAREASPLGQLQYNRARWYDASAGRWLSSDPISFTGGSLNTYTYAGNEPLSSTDAMGLCVDDGACASNLLWPD